jgi:hypothetical protein
VTRKRAAEAPKTFDIRSWQDVLAKLHRELERIKKTDNREDLIDHSFNFAVTAWQMADWLWADVQDKPKLKARVAAVAWIPPAKFTFFAFKKLICGANGCAALECCRVIATCSKHVGVEHTGYASMSPAVMPVQPHELRVMHGLQADGKPIIFIRARWTPEIRIESRMIPAIQLFEEALTFWNDFVKTHKLR